LTVKSDGGVPACEVLWGNAENLPDFLAGVALVVVKPECAGLDSVWIKVQPRRVYRAVVLKQMTLIFGHGSGEEDEPEKCGGAGRERDLHGGGRWTIRRKRDAKRKET
jgi:hypothetical protein